MGLASGTIGAIVIGLALGAVVAILTTIASRSSRKRTPLKSDAPGEMGLAARDGPHQPGPHIAAGAQGPRAD